MMVNPNREIVNTHQRNDEKKRKTMKATPLVLVAFLAIAGFIYFTMGLFII